METEDDDQRRRHLVAHALALKTRVRELSAKAYWEQFEATPGFVVMFVPNEACLGRPSRRMPTCSNTRPRRRCSSVRPINLYALLKAVAFGWQQQEITDNAREIAAQGQDLYGRLGKFVSLYSDIGKNLERSVKSFNRATGSLDSRLVPAMRRFRELGVGTEAIEEPVPLDVSTTAAVSARRMSRTRSDRRALLTGGKEQPQVGQLVAYFAIFCALVLLPAVILGWSIAARWLDIQQEMLQFEREKVRLLSERAKIKSEEAEIEAPRTGAVRPPARSRATHDSRAGSHRRRCHAGESAPNLPVDTRRNDRSRCARGDPRPERWARALLARADRADDGSADDHPGVEVRVDVVDGVAIRREDPVEFTGEDARELDRRARTDRRPAYRVRYRVGVDDCAGRYRPARHAGDCDNRGGRGVDVPRPLAIGRFLAEQTYRRTHPSR